MEAPEAPLIKHLRERFHIYFVDCVHFLITGRRSQVLELVAEPKNLIVVRDRVLLVLVPSFLRVGLIFVSFLRPVYLICVSVLSTKGSSTEHRVDP